MDSLSSNTTTTQETTSTEESTEEMTTGDSTMKESSTTEEYKTNEHSYQEETTAEGAPLTDISSMSTAEPFVLTNGLIYDYSSDDVCCTPEKQPTPRKKITAAQSMAFLPSLSTDTVIYPSSSSSSSSIVAPRIVIMPIPILVPIPPAPVPLLPALFPRALAVPLIQDARILHACFFFESKELVHPDDLSTWGVRPPDDFLGLGISATHKKFNKNTRKNGDTFSFQVGLARGTTWLDVTVQQKQWSITRSTFAIDIYHSRSRWRLCWLPCTAMNVSILHSTT